MMATGTDGDRVPRPINPVWSGARRSLGAESEGEREEGAWIDARRRRGKQQQPRAAGREEAAEAAEAAEQVEQVEQAEEQLSAPASASASSSSASSASSSARLVVDAGSEVPRKLAKEEGQAAGQTASQSDKTGQRKAYARGKEATGTWYVVASTSPRTAGAGIGGPNLPMEGTDLVCAHVLLPTD